MQTVKTIDQEIEKAIDNHSLDFLDDQEPKTVNIRTYDVNTRINTRASDYIYLKVLIFVRHDVDARHPFYKMGKEIQIGTMAIPYFKQMLKDELRMLKETEASSVSMQCQIVEEVILKIKNDEAADGCSPLNHQMSIEWVGEEQERSIYEVDQFFKINPFKNVEYNQIDYDWH